MNSDLADFFFLRIVFEKSFCFFLHKRGIALKKLSLSLSICFSSRQRNVILNTGCEEVQARRPENFPLS